MDCSLSEQYPDVVRCIESLEREERIKWHSHLQERAPNVEIDDVQRLAAAAAQNEENIEKDNNTSTNVASLVHGGLKEFSLQLLPPTVDPSSYHLNLTKLDVSNNELSALPGLATLSNLEVLCIRRNWFNTLPSDVGKLQKLREIDASRNFLKPNNESLRFTDLKSLSHLKVLDVSLNQKCRTAQHREFIQNNISPSKEVEVRVTIWQEKSNVEHNCIGSSAAVRDPNLLRSQLEPWGTVNLRRRLVRDFGKDPTDPALVDRAEVMDILLACYKEEGVLECDSDDLNLGVGKRRIVMIDGKPVRRELLDEILEELRDWRGNNKRGGSSANRERPSINAQCYMILRAPRLSGASNSDANGKLSRRDRRRHKKMEGNTKLWELALRAMKETDPEFAERCSEIAVTYGFIGSPHIDRQNASPFYGLALGEFTEGTGGVCVECSPRILAQVNTKNRLGRVDGRWPHWVSGYNVEGEERFSLIYYDTMSAYRTPGPAIFEIPKR